MTNTLNKYIGMVEGIGFKAILCANRMNQIVIGASGGMFAASPQQLDIYLKKAAQISNTNRVLLYPDAGAVLNPSILIQYQKTASLVLNKGFELKVAWWGQITKSQPDIDEYCQIFEIISFRSFLRIARKYLNN